MVKESFSASSGEHYLFLEFFSELPTKAAFSASSQSCEMSQPADEGSVINSDNDTPESTRPKFIYIRMF